MNKFFRKMQFTKTKKKGKIIKALYPLKEKKSLIKKFPTKKTQVPCGFSNEFYQYIRER